MTTSIRITYYGMEGEGSSLKEAKADAARKVEAAIEGDYQPVYLHLSEMAVIVYRTPRDGWSYAFTHGRADGDQLHGINYGGRAECIRHAKMHLAQNAIHAIPDDELGAYVHKDDRRELERYMQWQHLAKAWQLADPSLGSSEIHRLACEGEWPDGYGPDTLIDARTAGEWIAMANRNAAQRRTA